VPRTPPITAPRPSFLSITTAIESIRSIMHLVAREKNYSEFIVIELFLSLRA
jgi:hypothetical protein